MNTFEVKEPILISTLIETVRLRHEFDDDLCLYSSDAADRIRADLVCYLDDYPDVVNDKDHYSTFVTTNNLHLLYYGEQFKDVMINALTQKPQASIGEIIEALNYYMENDDFLDIN
jgi:hypothetical protein